ncbi:MAG: hypothetical protein KZQ93_01375 [Candidatus Thiodiazotropha sp. (ex Monitilora ramsayi)]|nr:hypothetical protein [Candidatus Thiodiazotropha sp. (ex Monitilora ramsayi)]
MQTKIYLFALISLLLYGASAQALNLKWLEFSPVRHFTAEDWEIAREAARRALSEAANGEGVTWNNERTGHYGSLTPISDRDDEGKRCRDMVIKHFAGGLNGGGTYRFCLMEDGVWKVLGGKLGQ